MKPNNGSADTMLLGFVPQHQPTMRSVFMSDGIDYDLLRMLQKHKIDMIFISMGQLCSQVYRLKPRGYNSKVFDIRHTT